MTMISCERVGFTYDGEHFVLNNVDVHIQEGEFVSILGGNGSGKSTLAKHMNALLIPDEGSGCVEGVSTSDPQHIYLIRSCAGMVFQNPDDQLVASLVEDDVAFGPENLGVPTDEMTVRVHDALEQVGLMSFEKHETHALSGGQKQRVAIAGVLAMKPKVLILDEASSMLDPRGRKGLMRVCKELHAQGMTIVMITHFMEEAAEADRVIVMNNGHIAATGTPQEILTQSELLAQLNLETPFACALSNSLQREGIPVATCVQEHELVQEILKHVTSTCNTSSACACTQEIKKPQAKAIDTTREPVCAPSDQVDTTRESVCVPSNQIDTTREPVCAPSDFLGTDTTSARNAQPIISFKDVSYTYNPPKKTKRRFFAPQAKNETDKKQADWGNDPEALWALEHINLDIYPGEFFGIAGHTGSGKSTLIQHMNGIINPTHGHVYVCGTDVAQKQEATRVRSLVGVVFQYPEHQLFADTVFNDVAFGPRNLGLDEDTVTKRVTEALHLVDLDVDAIGDVSPFELSGGQQRRVAFAGVLAMKPKVLVLDEPVAGLDPLARHEFLELVKKFHTQGITIVMVSHNMDDLAQYCTRMAVLKQGQLIEVGTPHEVFLHLDELNEIGLGVPSSQRVAALLACAGLPIAQDTLYTCESLTRAICDIARIA